MVGIWRVNALGRTGFGIEVRAVDVAADGLAVVVIGRVGRAELSEEKMSSSGSKAFGGSGGNCGCGCIFFLRAGLIYA